MVIQPKCGWQSIFKSFDDDTKWSSGSNRKYLKIKNKIRCWHLYLFYGIEKLGIAYLETFVIKKYARYTAQRFKIHHIGEEARHRHHWRFRSIRMNKDGRFLINHTFYLKLVPLFWLFCFDVKSKSLSFLQRVVITNILIGPFSIHNTIHGVAWISSEDNCLRTIWINQYHLKVIGSNLNGVGQIISLLVVKLAYLLAISPWFSTEIVVGCFANAGRLTLLDSHDDVRDERNY